MEEVLGSFTLNTSNTPQKRLAKGNEYLLFYGEDNVYSEREK